MSPTRKVKAHLLLFSAVVAVLLYAGAASAEPYNLSPSVLVMLGFALVLLSALSRRYIGINK